MVDACFRVVGRGFQCFGTVYLNDLWSEVLITRLLWDPLVLWEWSILLAKDAILTGNMLFVCLKEKHLILCLKRSSIFSVRARANRGSAWERRWVPNIILRKHFCRRSILSLYFRLRSSLKLPQLTKQYWRWGRAIVLYRRRSWSVCMNLRALPMIPTVWLIFVITLLIWLRHEMFLSR